MCTNLTVLLYSVVKPYQLLWHTKLHSLFSAIDGELPIRVPAVILPGCDVERNYYYRTYIGILAEKFLGEYLEAVKASEED